MEVSIVILPPDNMIVKKFSQLIERHTNDAIKRYFDTMFAFVIMQ